MLSFFDFAFFSGDGYVRFPAICAFSGCGFVCLHYETPSAMTVFACVDFSAVTVCDTVIDLDGLIRSFDRNRPMQINDIN
jgi:hypothetical protein